jgi:hypothetical protein
MPELAMSSGRIFREWWDRYGKRPGLETPTTFPIDPSLSTSAPPTPSQEADPQLQEEHALDAAAGNQDGGWTGPTPGAPGATILDSIKSGAKSLGEGVQNLSQPAKMGLLTAGLSMMATPPRAVPYSNTEILGQAGLAGVTMYEKALESQRRQQGLDESMEEKKLAREDRRTAAEDKGQYYRDVAETRRLTAESQAEARKATAAENAVLDVPIDPAVAKHYGIKPETTVRMFNKMQTGLVAMAKPEKETKTDAFTKWYESFGEAGPTRKDLESWHRGPGSGGGTDSGPGKVGAIGAVNRELVAQYLPHGRTNLEAKGPAGMEELKGMMVMLGNTDQYGGTVNDARLRESLNPEQRKEYDFVKQKGQDYSRTMTPANAIAKAQQDWNSKHPASAAPKPPAAAATKPEASKQVNGVWYDKIGGKWYTR